jgi:hypothetical protein
VWFSIFLHECFGKESRLNGSRARDNELRNPTTLVSSWGSEFTMWPELIRARETPGSVAVDSFYQL